MKDKYIYKIGSVESWIVFVDGFTGELIYGWAKLRNSDISQKINIFINGLCVGNNISCCNYRYDLYSAGFDSGKYGFSIQLDIQPHNKGKIEIYALDEGKLIAEFNYDLLAQCGVSNLQSRAEKLLSLGYKAEAAECYLALFDKSSNAEFKKVAYEIISDLPTEVIYDHLLFAKAKDVGEFSIGLANLPLSDLKLNRKDALMQCLKRYFYLNPTYFQTTQMREYLGIFSGILMTNNDIKIKTIFNNYLENYIFSHLTYPKIKIRSFSIFNEKICVIASSPVRLAHIMPVLQKLPGELLNFIFIYACGGAKEILDSAGIEGYKIIHGIDNIKNYNILLFDQMHFYDLKQFDLSKKLIIIYSHGVERDIYRYRQANLCICSSEFQFDIADKAIIKYFDHNNIEKLSKLDPEYKTEFVYSGPFHITSFLINEKDKKNKARSILLESLQMEFDKEYPVIAFFEDAYALPGHIVYCLNRLAKYCTIIVKPFDNAKSEYLSKLSSNISIYDKSTWAPNDLRYGADWIMCGYRSGVFASSLMVGLNVIPYYSRIIKCKFQNDGLTRWQDLIPCPQSHLHHQCDFILRQKWHNYFDLLDIESIYKAIFDNEYEKWIKDNIATLQRDVFGNYNIEDSSGYIAECILKFVCNGTLGRQASAVYFKDSFFD